MQHFAAWGYYINLNWGFYTLLLYIYTSFIGRKSQKDIVFCKKVC